MKRRMLYQNTVACCEVCKRYQEATFYPLQAIERKLHLLVYINNNSACYNKKRLDQLLIKSYFGTFYDYQILRHIDKSINQINFSHKSHNSSEPLLSFRSYFQRKFSINYFQNILWSKSITNLFELNLHSHHELAYQSYLLNLLSSFYIIICMSYKRNVTCSGTVLVTGRSGGEFENSI